MALAKPLAWERRAVGSPWLLLRLPGVLGELWDAEAFLVVGAVLGELWDVEAFLVVGAASKTGIIEVGPTSTVLVTEVAATVAAGSDPKVGMAPMTGSTVGGQI